MKILTTLCCAAFALCSVIYAQPPADHIMVHFNTSVIVGDTKLPAGDCDIQVMRGSSDSIILVLRSPGALAIAAVASHLSEGDTDAEASRGQQRSGPQRSGCRPSPLPHPVRRSHRLSVEQCRLVELPRP